MRTIILNGKIVIPSGVIDGSIIIDAHGIRHIIEGDEVILVQIDRQTCEIIDAEGCYVMPGLANSICSDYFCFALLASVFILVEEGLSLHEAVSYASVYSARNLGLAGRLSSLEEGKEADLILVRHEQGRLPIVEKVMVAGKWTFSKQRTPSQML